MSFCPLLNREAADELGLEPGILADWTAAVPGSRVGPTVVEPAGPGLWVSCLHVRRPTWFPGDDTRPVREVGPGCLASDLP